MAGAGPRTPLQFLQLERRVCEAAGQQADEILGQHLIEAHQDPDFVEQAVKAAGGAIASLCLATDLLPTGLSGRMWWGRPFHFPRSFDARCFLRHSVWCFIHWS